MTVIPLDVSRRKKEEEKLRQKQKFDMSLGQIESSSSNYTNAIASSSDTYMTEALEKVRQSKVTIDSAYSRFAGTSLYTESQREYDDLEKDLDELEREVESDIKKIAKRKVTKTEPKEEQQVNVSPSQAEQPVRTDPKAEAWAAKNSWFGNDTAMTYTAFDMHKTLVEKEGYDPQSDEYYEEIDKRLRVEFPNKFDKVADNTAERAKPAQTVASARRPANTGRRKTVKLTPSQVAIAKRLGVPLEEYAKQLNVKEGA